MNRLLKLLLIAFSVLVMLVVAAVFGVNLYVQSPATKARLQEGISHALGVPVELTKVTVGWSGLQISGVRVPSPVHPLLEANYFAADYELLPLLSKKLVVKKMTLESPRVIWAQNAEGKWVLPLLPEKGTPKEPALPNAEHPKAQTSPGLRAGGYDLVLDKMEVHHGAIELLNAKQERVGVATEVEMLYTLHASGEVEGTISAGSVTWGSGPPFTGMRSSLHYQNGELVLPDLRAAIAEGEVQGKATVQTQVPDSPFSMEVRLEKLDLARLSTEGGWAPEQTTGRLSGEVTVEGTLRQMEKTTGKGRLTVTDGHFQQLDFFQTIGQVLQVPELADLKVRTGQADFHFANEKTTLDALLLETGDLQFSTKGTVGFDGKLKLEANLAVTKHLAEQLPTFVRSKFTPPDAQGRQSISFDITGRADKPKSNLVNRIIVPQLTGQLDDVLNGLFGPRKGDKNEKKESKKDKKKNEEPTAPEGTEPGAPAPTKAPKTPTGATPVPEHAAPAQP